ncbi:hypothetical protein [Streptomyces aureocirculatus]|uniref:hypothetical protein n=1 Tax=Streptomyces aureocirculatus TaxID=67275 RepID=UPI00068F7FF0|nr:hypothetical protein [Streptomyces aureocirculatus]
MPTAIAVTSPDLVLPSPDRHTPTATVLQGLAGPGGGAATKGAVGANGAMGAMGARGAKGSKGSAAFSLEQALTEAHTLIEYHGYVIVLCPASAPPAVLHRLHTVRSVLETDRIAIVRSELPPLGLSVLALQLRQLSVCDFSPGVLACAARLLSHYIYAGALLGSVARLDRVPVTLQSHARSWVPGAQFAVLATPRPELVKAGGDTLLAGPGFSTKMLYATGQLTPDWVLDTLAPAWNVQGCADVRLPGESARWWATGKLVEFAAAIPDISVLYQLVSSVRREDCRWCGLELIGDRCAFCAAPLLPPSERAPAERAPTERESAAAPGGGTEATAVRALPRGAT